MKSRNEMGSNLLDWLDQRKPSQFVAILYALRWFALAPVMVLTPLIFNEAQRTRASMPDDMLRMDAGVLLVFMVFIGPFLETLVECTVPYFIISRIRDYRSNRPVRCWGFVATSACVMALGHPMLAALLPSLITGAFLAYCYAHFAEKSAGQAILATTVFHGAINIVGWTFIMIGRSA